MSFQLAEWSSWLQSHRHLDSTPIHGIWIWFVFSVFSSHFPLCKFLLGTQRSPGGTGGTLGHTHPFAIPTSPSSTLVTISVNEFARLS